MVFPLLRRQSGRKCSQSPVSTGISAEKFYPDFENKRSGENCGPLLGCLVLNCRIPAPEIV